MRKNYKLEVVAGITMPKLFNNKGKKKWGKIKKIKSFKNSNYYLQKSDYDL